MEEVKINFLKTREPSRKNLFFFLKIFSVLVVTAALVGVLTAKRSGSDGFFAELGQIPIVKRVRQLIHSADRTLLGARDDRVNILLLGMGGLGHDGPFLTDTIIVASIKPSTKQIALLSIPRDLAVPVPDHGWYKINHVNSFGETESSGSGGEFTREVLSEVLDLPIHYYVRIDFDGFMKLIDDLGGIEVSVDRSFTDAQFPTDSNGEVMTISFEAGRQMMNGETALQFARSRHGTNGEGSDFARARRQQKILQGVKSKVFSLGTLRSPTRIAAVVSALKEHVATNLSPWELIALAEKANGFEGKNTISEVLDNGGKGLLTSTTGVDGAYLLMPQENDWKPIRELAKNIFDQEPEGESKEPIRVEIQNGTTVTGLAAESAAELKAAGFLVERIGNAPERNHERTIIYDLSGGAREEARRKLQTLFRTEIVQNSPASLPSSVDFLIILGQDRAS